MGHGLNLQKATKSSWGDGLSAKHQRTRETMSSSGKERFPASVQEPETKSMGGAETAQEASREPCSMERPGLRLHRPRDRSCMRRRGGEPVLAGGRREEGRNRRESLTRVGVGQEQKGEAWEMGVTGNHIRVGRCRSIRG